MLAGQALRIEGKHFKVVLHILFTMADSSGRRWRRILLSGGRNEPEWSGMIDRLRAHEALKKDHAQTNVNRL
jgi:hypothetical protein